VRDPHRSVAEITPPELARLVAEVARTSLVDLERRLAQLSGSGTAGVRSDCAESCLSVTPRASCGRLSSASYGVDATSS